MNRIAAPAHVTADEPERTAAFTHGSLFARVLNSLISTVIRKEEDDIAKWYEGSSWCDQTEHDLNEDVMTGRRTRQGP
jgi:hypothetical protein